MNQKLQAELGEALEKKKELDEKVRQLNALVEEMRESLSAARN